MFEIQGKYTTAKVFATTVEETAIAQILEICNQPFTEGCQIRIMPDVHAGKGCTIGTTLTIKDKVVANLVGVDIGCGMHVWQLKGLTLTEEDLAKLDESVRYYIPSGMTVRTTEHPLKKKIDLTQLKCVDKINLNRAYLSIGTLGGGNHFIELNKDEQDNIYLVVHTGSRNLGKQIAEYYQDLAYKELINKQEISQAEQKEIIVKLTNEGKQHLIGQTLKQHKATNKTSIPKDLAYLEGESMKDYLHDMGIAQAYANLNRVAIGTEIIKAMAWENNIAEDFETIHNYIDLDKYILRKGAIAAHNGEKVIIPINMRDGSIIAIGKGNEDMNCSAPHGAGRLMSRSKAKELVTLEDFQESMTGIYTTSVNTGTLDESPMAYKPMEEILENIKDTVDIVSIIKPIYNFKASEAEKSFKELKAKKKNNKC